MKHLTLALFALLAVLAANDPAVAAPPPGVTQLRTSPSTLAPDRAYLLLRSGKAKSGLFAIEHVLVRAPSASDLTAYRAAREAAYRKELPRLQKQAKDGPVTSIDEFVFDYKGEANAFATKRSDNIDVGDLVTMLIEVPPGTYILYGTGVGSRGLVTCNCLGTVQFEAKVGIITDLGSLYADKVHGESPEPHLEDNLGKSMFNYGFVLGQAVVPATSATPVVAGLQGLPRVVADYHAVGLFREPGASINRLAPIPGILRYDRGKVINERTGLQAK